MQNFWPINQERARGVLRGAVAADRVAHAYLFHGPDGVGKRAVALEFAQALLCESGSGEACGRCIHCQKVVRGVHPDLHVLIPQPKDASPEEVGRRLALLFEDPYATVDYARRPVLDDPDKASGKQAGYHIERVHDQLHRAFSFKPVEGSWKIGIVTDADLFGGRSANAFLKLLEEPSARTVFVMTTSRVDHILPTILSRCQRLAFATLPPSEIAGRLVGTTDLTPADAEIVARMSDGSFSRAAELAGNPSLMLMRRSVIEVFRAIWAYDGKGRPADRDLLIDLISQHAALGRERVKNILRLMLSWLGDIVVYRATGDSASLVNVDQAEEIRNFSDGIPAADVEAMVALVEEAFDLAARNVNLNLLLTRLYNEIRRAMRGDATEGLYVPLVDWLSGVVAPVKV
jgi:DNA polymerase-3 subunit delta'